MKSEPITLQAAVGGLFIAQAAVGTALVGYLIGAGVINGEAFLDLMGKLEAEASDPVALLQYKTLRAGIAASIKQAQAQQAGRPALTVLQGGKE